MSDSKNCKQSYIKLGRERPLPADQIDPIPPSTTYEFLHFRIKKIKNDPTPAPPALPSESIVCNQCILQLAVRHIQLSQMV